MGTQPSLHIVHNSQLLDAKSGALGLFTEQKWCSKVTTRCVIPCLKTCMKWSLACAGEQPWQHMITSSGSKLCCAVWACLCCFISLLRNQSQLQRRRFCSNLSVSMILIVLAQWRVCFLNLPLTKFPGRWDYTLKANICHVRFSRFKHDVRLVECMKGG